MRYWGQNIQIDGSFYKTEMGKNLLPTSSEMVQYKATGNYFQHEGNVETYEETVQNMMRDIEANSVGKVLIAAINRSPLTLRIIPLTSKEQSQSNKVPCSIPVGSYNPRGSESVIWFEPWSRIPNLIVGTGSSPYQVLVHELQHSLRQMLGKWFVSNKGRVGGFPNLEELFSVLIENMYLSAAGRPQLMLGSYDPVASLGSRTDVDFYKQYGNEVNIWCDEMRDLTIQFERISGIWNPIKVRREALNSAVKH